MRKIKLPILLTSAFLLLGGLTSFSYLKSNVISKAEEEKFTYIFEEEKDLSRKARGSDFKVWRASDGLFPKVDNWFYSGKGFSFEFRFQGDVSFANAKDMTATLKSGNTDLTNPASQSYILHFDKKTHEYVRESNTIGQVSEVGSGWYKFEIMFAEYGNLIVDEESAKATVDGLGFQWVDASSVGDYWNDLTVRRMKLIEEFPTMTYSNELTSKKYVNAHDTRALPQYKGFFSNQNVGLFINFKLEKKEDQTYKNIYAGFGSLNTNEVFTDFYYLYNNGVASHGKLFSLGDDWYRYEVMVYDLPLKSSVTSTSNLGSIYFNWESDYAFHQTKGYGIISSYSYLVNYVIDGVTTSEIQTGFARKPTDPSKANYHFVNWYLDSQYTLAYDFSQPLSSDITLYARFAEGSQHVFNKEVVDEKYFKEEATCCHGDIYYKSCVCGEIDGTTFEHGEINPNNHNESEPTMINFVDPTCSTKGSYDEVITCLDCKKVLDSKHFDINQTGHKYVEKKWTLSEDKKSATLLLVCEHNPNETITLNCDIDITKQDSTYEKAGTCYYTLKADFEGKHYSHVILETIPVKERPNPSSQGCQGSILATSAIISLTSLVGLSVLFVRKRKEDK